VTLADFSSSVIPGESLVRIKVSAKCINAKQREKELFFAFLLTSQAVVWVVQSLMDVHDLLIFAHGNHSLESDMILLCEESADYIQARINIFNSMSVRLSHLHYRPKVWGFYERN